MVRTTFRQLLVTTTTPFLLLTCLFEPSLTFTVRSTTTKLQQPQQWEQEQRRQQRKTTQWFEICNNDHGAADDHHSSSSSFGDKLREATGIRPSLHPTTINALAQALKIRAQNINNPDKSLIVDNNDSGDGPTSLEVAVRAGKIATDAIQSRQANSNQDGMTLTPEEQQTIAGRVVGVVMRFTELEKILLERVMATSWVAKFGDWNSFGVLNADEETSFGDVQQRIKDDPLFTMTRAECLLALFLETVESPTLEAAGQEVPDKGQIDFLDEDRKDVLLLS